MFKFQTLVPNKEGCCIVDNLGDMAYKETILHLNHLMYVTNKDHWLYLYLCNLIGDWLHLDQPSTFVTTFLKTYSLPREQFLAHEDKSYFLNVMQRSGKEPAPFIPILGLRRYGFT
jgi:enoyl reductase-like protein